jgi:hypothetical protein
VAWLLWCVTQGFGDRMGGGCGGTFYHSYSLVGCTILRFPISWYFNSSLHDTARCCGCVGERVDERK